MQHPLNFHHLHYFWSVARDGNLTRTAARLHVSQSALSSQIRQLEDALGHALFRRESRRLLLTEAGQLCLGYADQIFAAGGELMATVKHGRKPEDLFRVGAVATLSRNFQESFIKPLLGLSGVRLRLQAGGLDDLLERLDKHDLDLVLSNRPVQKSSDRVFRCRRIARQEVSIVGHRRTKRFRFPDDLQASSMILPGPDNEIRTEFDALCAQLEIEVRPLVEVDDMATMRLLARDTKALALVPSVVVRDELRNKVLYEYCVVPGLYEKFYAITVDRRFQHPLVKTLLKRDEDDLLAMDA